MLHIEDFQNSKNQPVIIIGMHRSGTSMLTRILGQHGLFIGKDVQDNYESMLFMMANNSIFATCNATWNKPFGVHLALQNSNLISSLSNSVVNYLEFYGARYFGTGENGAGEFPDVNYIWGWKDPRNTFTLPVWKHIFPDSKIIHILRHGVDAAYSLYQRDWVKQDIKSYISSLATVRDEMGLIHARPSSSLEQAFLLWEDYVEKATQYLDADSINTLQIRYEDFLEEPESILQEILTFCGIKTDSHTLETLETFDSSRAFSYKNSPELLEFANRWSDTLARYGY